jgi:hypothetical protein
VGVMVATVVAQVATKAAQVRHVQRPVLHKPHGPLHPQPVARTCLTWMTIFRFKLS